MTSTDHESWATQTFGLRVRHRSGTPLLTELVAPGLRRNPRRAHLLVSSVLGKHIAADPRDVIAAGHQLGRAVASLGLGDVDVLGMAETATSLGHCVADNLDAAMYLHTTRRHAPPNMIYAEFQEGHSHATDHTLQPSSADLFAQPRPIVLVDDEISTGNTAFATVAALQQLQHRAHYVVASLVDVRNDTHRHDAAAVSNKLRTSVHFVSLAQGDVDQPAGLIDAVCALNPPVLNTPSDRPPSTPSRLTLPWPAHVPEGGRHGFLRQDRPEFEEAVLWASEHLHSYLDPSRPVLLVGHEELMYLPLRLADQLARHGFNTRFQSTTRSPAYVHNHPEYPLGTGWTFPASEPGETSARFLYNGWQAPPHVRVQLVLLVDRIAASGDLTVGEVLAASGYDVIIAEVDGPDATTHAEIRGRQQ